MSNKTLRRSESKNFSEMNTPTPKKQAEQPLKRSTYNIYEAYDSSDFTLDSSSIHPLEVSAPYAFDLSPTKVNQADLNTMMQDLDLSAPASNSSQSMPYCV